MANDARKTALPLKGKPQSHSAKQVYKKEAESLTAKLRTAERNAPYERQAQLIASVQVSQRRQANPHIEKEDYKKIKQQALNEARLRTGAHKDKIKITQSEWDAIQAGAISNHKLQNILKNADMDTVKVLAMPKTAKPVLTSPMLRRAQAMANRGFTQAEIADALGVGLTTLKIGLSE
jgi:DNA-binding XRE family transcriptional regulator